MGGGAVAPKKSMIPTVRSMNLKGKGNMYIKLLFSNLMAGVLIIYHSPVRPVKVQILKVTL